MRTYSNKEKIDLANSILRLMEEEEAVAAPKHIGTLNKAWGMNGYKTAEIGSPVFATSDRYFIFIETVDGKTSLQINFYKETLEPIIDRI